MGTGTPNGVGRSGHMKLYSASRPELVQSIDNKILEIDPRLLRLGHGYWPLQREVTAHAVRALLSGMLVGPERMQYFGVGIEHLREYRFSQAEPHLLVPVCREPDRWLSGVDPTDPKILHGLVRDASAFIVELARLEEPLGLECDP